jgi:magnesium chelatase subunit H
MPKLTSAADPALMSASLVRRTHGLMGSQPIAQATTQKQRAPAVVPTRVVLVTMDSHLASAAHRAGRSLASRLPGLNFSVHAADEWGSDDAALARCKADIAEGDIVIVTMLFMEDHFLPLLPTLQARRDQCDAMVCAMSAAEVTKLTRMGKFDMSKPTSALMGMLKKLRGKPAADQKGGAQWRCCAGCQKSCASFQAPRKTCVLIS